MFRGYQVSYKMICMILSYSHEPDIAFSLDGDPDKHRLYFQGLFVPEL